MPIVPRYTIGLGYEELREGMILEGHAVTVTEAHIVLFAGLSGDYNPLHLDEEFARKWFFGGRIAHGLLTVTLVSGSLGMMFAGTAIAFIEASIKFKHPVKPGDTIHPRAVVREKKDKPEYNGGIVVLEVEVVNQENTVVVEGVFKLIVVERKKLEEIVGD